MKLINFALPEFAFLDGQSHLGNELEDRTVLMHIRSGTVMEVINVTALEAEGTFSISANAPARHEFNYANDLAGVEEVHLFVVLFTQADPDMLPSIFTRCEKFYTDYLRWEDRNILSNEQGKRN